RALDSSTSHDIPATSLRLTELPLARIGVSVYALAQSVRTVCALGEVACYTPSRSTVKGVVETTRGEYQYAHTHFSAGYADHCCDESAEIPEVSYLGVSRTPGCDCRNLCQN